MQTTTILSSFDILLCKTLLLNLFFENIFYIRHNKLIILKNILRIKNLSQKYYYEKIIFIDRDREKNIPILNKIVVTLQLVATISYLFAQNFDLILQNS